MISENQKREILLAADIKEVVEKCNVKLIKRGTCYMGLCPFHDEKTASFAVYDKTNRFVCFSCGKRGNVVDFLMEIKGLTFLEAMRYLAKEYHIVLEEYTPTSEEEKAEKNRKQQYQIYEAAAAYFSEQLKTNPQALAYARSRFSDDTIDLFRLGYAPDKTSLYPYLRNKGFNMELLEKCDLFRQGKFGVTYDFFRNRLMFPIIDLYGKVIAFSGRTLETDPEKQQAKYINNSDTILYNKGKVLFGLNCAFRSIKKNDLSILVEGNADVVKMHQLGIENVIAACGTALTDEQIKLLGKMSRNFCLMLDGDDAGQRATLKNGKRITEVGFNAYVIEIPKNNNGEKQDPDSFFHSQEHFEKFSKFNKISFLEKLAKDKQSECEDAVIKTKVIREISLLFYQRTESERITLVEQLAKIIPNKRIWLQTIKELEKIEKDKKSFNHITHIDLNGRTDEQEKQIRRYGFYIEKNCYFFSSVKGECFYQGSNFILEPLFHIESTINAKRLYRLKNIYGTTKVLELNQKDLISISAFRLRCESLGNFLFDAGDLGLCKIKSYLYDQTKTCKEIVQQGWQKYGFFAWANGIVADNKFVEINELGIVEYQKQYYYLPALSTFYQEEDTLFQFERKFIHHEGSISLFDYSDKMQIVYGDNAIVGLSYYFASLFRDIIISSFRFFPLLNIFGPKGTGKSEMAVSLLKLFGDLPVGLNMTNSTIPALADHVSRSRNALCHIDEYKNSVEYEKIEFLKGLWDGVGRSRMNMEKDRKKEMTAVDAGIMLTGQEMTTADNALFSRVIFLSFTKTKFSDEEKADFNLLKKIEKEGLTQITNHLLSYRKKFLSEFVPYYNSAMDDILQYIVKSKIEDRILKNWIILLASLKIIIEEESLPFSYEKATKVFSQLIERQNKEVYAGNEVSDFWNVYQELFSSGLIENDYDLQIKVVQELKTNIRTIEQPIQVLFVNPIRIFSLYAQSKKNNNEKKLPKDTLQYYLQNSDEYLGTQQKRFRKPIRNLQIRDAATQMPGDGTIAYEYERPYAWCFDYAKLVARMGLNLITEFVKEDNQNSPPINENSDDEQNIFPY